jgi:hypothetical protein
MNELPENYVMPEPPELPDWYTPPTTIPEKLTDADLFDMKCSDMDYNNSWYR